MKKENNRKGKSDEFDIKWFKTWLEDPSKHKKKLCVEAQRDCLSRFNSIERVLDFKLNKNEFTKNPKYVFDIKHRLEKSKSQSKKSIISALNKYFEYVLMENYGAKKTDIFDQSKLQEWKNYCVSLDAIKNNLNLNGNTLGSFAESIVANSLDLLKFKDSEKGIDLIDNKKNTRFKTYQVKSRKVNHKTDYEQELNICKELKFDFLITLIFLTSGELLFATEHTNKQLEDIKGSYIKKKKDGSLNGYVFRTNKYFLEKGKCITKKIINSNKLLKCDSTVYNWNDLP